MKKILITLFVALCLFAVVYNAYQSEKQATTGKRKVYATAALINDMLSKNIELNQENFLKQKTFDDISGQFKFTKLGDTTYPYVMATLKNGKIIPLEKEEK